MPTISRTIKVAVSFPGWRRADLFGTKDAKGLLYQLQAARSDMTRAANKALEALYLVRRGAIPHPEKNGKKANLRTLAYQAMNGTWQPYGEPLYTPSEATRAVGASVLLDTAGAVHTRLREDYKGIVRGEQTLSTFRTLPLLVEGAGVAVHPDFRVTLRVWAGTRNNRITVKPIKPGAGQRQILHRLVSGEYKLGNAKLYKDDRKGKWMLSLSWTGEVQEAKGDLVAGIDLGQATAATLAYVDQGTGKPTRTRDRVEIPERVFRGWRRAQAENRKRLRSNRNSDGIRSGRGRARKLRVAGTSSDALSRVVDSTLRETAARIVNTVKSRGASVIVLEDLKGFAQRHMDQTSGLSRRRAAWARRRWMEWHYGGLRDAIINAALREGLTVIRTDQAYTSKTCSCCGAVWSGSLPKAVTKTLSKTKITTLVGNAKTEGTLDLTPLDVKKATGFGRINQATFKCDCGHEDHADRNAAVNLAHRGFRALEAAKRGLQAAK